MYFSKTKIFIISICLSLVLAGSLVIIKSQVQSYNFKKTYGKNNRLLKDSIYLTEKAELLISKSDLLEARSSLKKISGKEGGDLMRRLDQTSFWWDQINRAEKLVSSAEKIQSEINVERSQESIDKLSIDGAKKKKKELQMRLNEVKEAVANNKRRAMLKEKQ